MVVNIIDGLFETWFNHIWSQLQKYNYKSFEEFIHILPKINLFDKTLNFESYKNNKYISIRLFIYVIYIILLKLKQKPSLTIEILKKYSKNKYLDAFESNYNIGTFELMLHYVISKKELKSSKEIIFETLIKYLFIKDRINFFNELYIFNSRKKEIDIYRKNINNLGPYISLMETQSSDFLFYKMLKQQSITIPESFESFLDILFSINIKTKNIKLYPIILDINIKHYKQNTLSSRIVGKSDIMLGGNKQSIDDTSNDILTLSEKLFKFLNKIQNTKIDNGGCIDIFVNRKNIPLISSFNKDANILQGAYFNFNTTVLPKNTLLYSPKSDIIGVRYNSFNKNGAEYRPCSKNHEIAIIGLYLGEYITNKNYIDLEKNNQSIETPTSIFFNSFYDNLINLFNYENKIKENVMCLFNDTIIMDMQTKTFNLFYNFQIYVAKSIFNNYKQLSTDNCLFYYKNLLMFLNTYNNNLPYQYLSLPFYNIPKIISNPTPLILNINKLVNSDQYLIINDKINTNNENKIDNQNDKVIPEYKLTKNYFIKKYPYMCQNLKCQHWYDWRRVWYYQKQYMLQKNSTDQYNTPNENYQKYQYLNMQFMNKYAKLDNKFNYICKNCSEILHQKEYFLPIISTSSGYYYKYLALTKKSTLYANKDIIQIVDFIDNNIRNLSKLLNLESYFTHDSLDRLNKIQELKMLLECMQIAMNIPTISKYIQDLNIEKSCFINIILNDSIINDPIEKDVATRQLTLISLICVISMLSEIPLLNIMSLPESELYSLKIFNENKVLSSSFIQNIMKKLNHYNSTLLHNNDNIIYFIWYITTFYVNAQRFDNINGNNINKNIWQKLRGRKQIQNDKQIEYNNEVYEIIMHTFFHFLSIILDSKNWLNIENSKYIDTFSNEQLIFLENLNEKFSNKLYLFKQSNYILNEYISKSLKNNTKINNKSFKLIQITLPIDNALFTVPEYIFIKNNYNYNTSIPNPSFNIITENSFSSKYICNSGKLIGASHNFAMDKNKIMRCINCTKSLSEIMSESSSSNITIYKKRLATRLSKVICHKTGKYHNYVNYICKNCNHKFIDDIEIDHNNFQNLNLEQEKLIYDGLNKYENDIKSSLKKIILPTKTFINKKLQIQDIFTDYDPEYYTVYNKYNGNILRKNIKTFNSNDLEFKSINITNFDKKDILCIFIKDKVNNVNMVYEMNSLIYIGYYDSFKKFNYIKSLQKLIYQPNVYNNLLMLGLPSSFQNYEFNKLEIANIQKMFKIRFLIFKTIILRITSLINTIFCSPNIISTNKNKKRFINNSIFDDIIKKVDNRFDHYLFENSFDNYIKNTKINIFDFDWVYDLFNNSKLKSIKLKDLCIHDKLYIITNNYLYKPFQSIIQKDPKYIIYLKQIINSIISEYGNNHFNFYNIFKLPVFINDIYKLQLSSKKSDLHEIKLQIQQEEENENKISYVSSEQIADDIEAEGRFDNEMMDAFNDNLDL